MKPFFDGADSSAGALLFPSAALRLREGRSGLGWPGPAGLRAAGIRVRAAGSVPGPGQGHSGHGSGAGLFGCWGGARATAPLLGLVEGSSGLACPAGLDAGVWEGLPSVSCAGLGKLGISFTTIGCGQGGGVQSLMPFRGFSTHGSWCSLRSRQRWACQVMSGFRFMGEASNFRIFRFSKKPNKIQILKIP